MICPKCGAASFDGAKFCESCGAPLAAEQPANPTQDVAAEPEAAAPEDAAAAPTPQQPPVASPQAAYPPPQSGAEQQAGVPPYAQQPNAAPYGQQPPMPPYGQQPPAPKTPWYGKTWVIILFLIFLWPVGLILMWMKTCAWQKVAKIIVTIVIAVLFVINIVIGVAGCSLAFNAIEEIDNRTPSTSQQLPSGNSNSGSSANSSWPSDCYDVQGNPSIYAVTELSGADLVEFLPTVGFTWDSSTGGFVNSRYDYVSVDDEFGTLTKSEIEVLARGGAGSNVSFWLITEGYSSITSAISGLSGGLTVVDTYVEDSEIGACVLKNHSGDRYLAIVSLDDGITSAVVYPETAIAGGLLDVQMEGSYGSSIAEVWRNLSGRSL